MATAPPPSAAAAPAQTAGFSLERLPLATVGLTVLLVTVFCVEQVAALSPPQATALGYRSLMALGGINAKLALHDGQGWRLFTAPLLHANLAHILGNGVVLLLVGARLERLIGRAWLLAVFGLSAVGGSLGSILLNPDGPVSVGASGAIMGLLTASLVCSFHIAAFEQRGRMRIYALRLLIPALLPTSGLIDYSCHFGGAVAGLAVGFVLQILWPEQAARPQLRWLAGLIAGGVAVLSLGGFALAGRHYPDYAKREAALIPDNLVPHADAEAQAAAAGLVARYPDDPRARLYQATASLKAGNPIEAEQALRTGLAQQDVLDNAMPAALRPIMTSLLAAALWDEGRKDEAKATAQPVCDMGRPPPALKPVQAKLRQFQLCR